MDSFWQLLIIIVVGAILIIGLIYVLEKNFGKT